MEHPTPTQFAPDLEGITRRGRSDVRFFVLISGIALIAMVLSLRFWRGEVADGSSFAYLASLRPLLPFGWVLGILGAPLATWGIVPVAYLPERFSTELLLRTRRYVRYGAAVSGIGLGWPLLPLLSPGMVFNPMLGPVVVIFALVIGPGTILLFGTPGAVVGAVIGLIRGGMIARKPAA